MQDFIKKEEVKGLILEKLGHIKTLKQDNFELIKEISILKTEHEKLRYEYEDEKQESLNVKKLEEDVKELKSDNARLSSLLSIKEKNIRELIAQNEKYKLGYLDTLSSSKKKFQSLFEEIEKERSLKERTIEELQKLAISQEKITEEEREIVRILEIKEKEIAFKELKIKEMESAIKKKRLQEHELKSLESLEQIRFLQEENKNLRGKINEALKKEHDAEKTTEDGIKQLKEEIEGLREEKKKTNQNFTERDTKLLELKNKLEGYKQAYLSGMSTLKKKNQELLEAMEKEKELRIKLEEEISNIPRTPELIIEKDNSEAKIKAKLIENTEKLKVELEARHDARVKDLESKYEADVKELSSKIKEIGFMLSKEIERNKVVEKENEFLKDKAVEMENKAKVFQQEFEQESFKRKRKEDYYPIMMRLNEEETNNRIAKLARESIKREMELEEEVVKLRKRIDGQLSIISSMRQAERELALGMSGLLRNILKKANAKVEAPEVPEHHKEEFEELKPMIKIALSHNDSRDMIKKSLISSGYKKELIEKVLNHYL